MNVEDDNSSCSTEDDEIQEQRGGFRERFWNMISSLDGALFNSFVVYEGTCKMRSLLLQCLDDSLRQQLYLINLGYLHALFHTYEYVNTPLYARYVNRYQHDPDYIDYVVELLKIKHNILEQEVDWYIKYMTECLEIENKVKGGLHFYPVLEQDPREARHTRAVINHALEQLETIASKINLDNAKDYIKDKERYSWCLAGMITLLPQEEQNPFKQNGIHQRWQKARMMIQQADSQQ
ncbi:unnamed protein product [Paramecium octaurelia]|uniref:Uncharacterized protein n=1 Tax=Paramecium octaurelia TaxID=43137 RepID=A0A8S1V7W8_PAROT|nr:unnamed protein product [Paramecium octaurelia]